ncbi:sensor histidine kinase [Novosphingobium bradum]|uniref:histidine kinase n=1 Tax=Novosphingobium bradum TaxID=1737444 RepID=A0ABV7IQZ9_9SPHN
MTDTSSEPERSASDRLHPVPALAALAMQPFAMVVADRDHRILAFCQAAESLFGYTEDETIGRPFASLFARHPGDLPEGHVARQGAPGEPWVAGAPRVENARRKDGSIFPVEVALREIELRGDTCRVAHLRALGEPDGHRRELQAMLGELAHTSRVAAMGAMATAIAHELNQPLTAIANYAEALRSLLQKRTDIAGREEFLRLADTCINHALSAGQLLHRVREFIKGGEPRTRPVAVASFVDEAIALALINGSRRCTRLTTALPRDLPPVLADPLLAQQVVFNLIRNALEELDRAGGHKHRLRIGARLADQPGFVEIAVEDSGPGIADEIAQTLFRSFVTTKSGGMGVGLAICKQIVEATGGQIRAERSIDLGGAALRFTLPVAASKPEQTKGG